MEKQSRRTFSGGDLKINYADWVLFSLQKEGIVQVHACVFIVKLVSRATQKTPKFSKCGCARRSYTEGDREGREVGRQQTEGNFEVVDEAICHLTVRCFLDEGAAAIAADGHHAVTLDAQKTPFTDTSQPSKSYNDPFKSHKTNTRNHFCLHESR